MINSYCDSLQDTFAQLVYYGILAEEDAQCFSVRSTIEGGSFMLAAGAVLLALLNTFVVKAVTQYFRDDRDALEKMIVPADEVSDVKSDHTSDTASEEESDVNGHAAARIQPVPVLFTDTFRWTLRRDDHGIDSSRSFVPEAVAKQEWQSLPEATAVEIDEDAGIYNKPFQLAAVSIEKEGLLEISKGKLELESKETSGSYRLKSPVPRAMSDAGDEGLQPLIPRSMSFSGDDEAGIVPEVMETEDSASDYFTEELIQEANREYESGYNDTRSVFTDEYTEEVLEDDEYTEQTFNDIPEEEYDDLTVEDRLV
jgi:hypothetical protein